MSYCFQQYSRTILWFKIQFHLLSYVSMRIVCVQGVSKKDVGLGHMWSLQNGRHGTCEKITGRSNVTLKLQISCRRCVPRELNHTDQSSFGSLSSWLDDVSKSDTWRSTQSFQQTKINIGDEELFKTSLF